MEEEAGAGTCRRAAKYAAKHPPMSASEGRHRRVSSTENWPSVVEGEFWSCEEKLRRRIEQRECRLNGGCGEGNGVIVRTPALAVRR
jgi:hypothetical protein